MGGRILVHLGTKNIPWIDPQCANKQIQNFHRRICFVLYDVHDGSLVQIGQNSDLVFR